MKIKDLMGKIVTVNQEYVRNDDPITHKVTWAIKNIKNPRAGWVTGQRSIQEGKRVFVDEEVGYIFEQSGRVPCILVVYWPTLKPVRVPMDGYVVVRISESGTDPHPPNGSPEDVELMQKYYAMFDGGLPRDAKGRFT